MGADYLHAETTLCDELLVMKDDGSIRDFIRSRIRTQDAVRPNDHPLWHWLDNQDADDGLNERIFKVLIAKTDETEEDIDRIWAYVDEGMPDEEKFTHLVNYYLESVVAAYKEVTNSREVGTVGVRDGMKFITGGVSWGDPPTGAFDHMCTLSWTDLGPRNTSAEDILREYPDACTEMLVDAVEGAAESAAMAVNSAGLQQQAEYLLDNGMTKEQIEELLSR